MIQEEEVRKVEERLKIQLKEIDQNYEEVEKTIVGLESQIVKAKKIVEDLTSIVCSIIFTPNVNIIKEERRKNSLTEIYQHKI